MGDDSDAPHEIVELRPVKSVKVRRTTDQSDLQVGTSS